jgi:predicted O-methyltransferase YrrM
MHFLLKICYFLSYYFRAHTIYDVHAPLLSDHLLPLFYGKRPSAVPVEHRRQSLIRDPRKITKTDYGAGSSSEKNNQLYVRNMAARSPVSRLEGSRLALLANKPNIKTILELGTHFGLSGAYLISLNRHARLFTVEGCPQTADIAAETFESLGLTHRVNQEIGSFDELLPSLLPRCSPIDLLFIDGNHRGKPLLQYLSLCTPYLAPNGIILISDIYWSADMKDTWRYIANQYPHFHAIDLFHFGILIPRRKDFIQRHNLALIDLKWKPWRIGLFP